MALGDSAQLSPAAASHRREVIGQLGDQADSIAAGFEETLRSSHPLYRSVDDPRFNEVMADTTRAAVRSLTDWMESGGHLPTEVIEYFQGAGAAAASQFVPLEALEGPIQSGTRILWDWLVEACGATAAGREAALCLVGELKSFEDALLRTITDAYVTVRFQPDVEEREVQRDLLEALLSGRAPDPRLQARLTGSFDLRPEAAHCVIVARVRSGRRSDARRALDLAQQGPQDRGVLMAILGGEIVAVRSHGEGQSQFDVREWARHLRRVHRIELQVAISTTGSTQQIPDRHREATRILPFADHDPDGVVTVESLRLFDYLARSDDPVAARLVPPAVQRLLVADLEQDSVSTRTLCALADADLNVGRAARLLGVHPNTVHYRLNRIADLTGSNPRSLHDLVDLLLAIRQADGTRRDTGGNDAPGAASRSGR